MTIIDYKDGLKYMAIKNIELLAPVGDFDSLYAAIASGADAVYLGGKAFSARASAANFNNEELIEVVNYCKLRQVKVYVTVNTLIKDKELASTNDFLAFLYKIGVDGVIIQDLGVWLLAEKYPGLEKHVSTQMTLHNTSAVEMLQKADAYRVVLSRELSLEEVAAIKNKTGISLEVFGHGALCFSYSGQCLMSSLLGERSGNRGRCAQPCRLNYSLLDQFGERYTSLGPYLLSPKDLRTGLDLTKLEGVVDSLKLEGRLKKPEYVATITRTYRALLDGSINLQEAEKTLREVFNRDFTKGYLFGERGRQIMGHQRPNMRGLFLGQITKSTGDSITIKLQQQLNKGDGIEVWLEAENSIGTVVGEIVKDGYKIERANQNDLVTIPLRKLVPVGAKVYKTKAKELISLAQSTYRSEREYRKQPLDFFVKAKIGSEFSIEVTNNDGVTGQGISEHLLEKAQKRPLSFEVLKEQLNRLGNTPYSLANLAAELDHEVMVPFSVINETRRIAIDDLEAKIIARSRRELVIVDLPEPPVTKKSSSLLIAEVATPNLFRKALEAKPDLIYISGERLQRHGFTYKSLEEARIACQAEGIPCYYVFPRIMHDNELKRESSFIATQKFDGYVVGNLGAFSLLKPQDKIVFDWGLNIMNYLAAEFLQTYAGDFCWERFTASLELEKTELVELAEKIPLEVVVHGNLPLMISENCIIGTTRGEGICSRCGRFCEEKDYYLEDRLKYRFPLFSDRDGRSHIYNSRDLCLIDEVSKIKEFASVRLMFSIEDEPVSEIIDAYKLAREQTLDASTLKDRLLAISPRPFTTGHYFRGVE